MPVYLNPFGIIPPGHGLDAPVHSVSRDALELVSYCIGTFMLGPHVFLKPTHNSRIITH